MPHATNPLDGIRTYFEDPGGNAPAVLFYTGFADPLEVAKASRLARELSAEFRLIFADHRGQGRSDKPRDLGAYALPTRAADAVAVLDSLNIDRAHFLGSSWGARLGFALGEHAPERVLSLVLCGNQPYAWTSIPQPHVRWPPPSLLPGETGWWASWSASKRRSTIGSRNRTGHGSWRRTTQPHSRQRGDRPQPKGRFPRT